MDTVVALESFIYGSAYDVHARADIFAVPEVSNELKMSGGEGNDEGSGHSIFATCSVWAITRRSGG